MEAVGGPWLGGESQVRGLVGLDEFGLEFFGRRLDLLVDLGADAWEGEEEGVAAFAEAAVGGDKRADETVAA